MKQHLCTDGRWREGPVADCPKHKKLSRKQINHMKPKDRGGSE